MIEDLIKLQKKKVQIDKKENIKVQQREWKLLLLL
jgi:hypothetical protein